MLKIISGGQSGVDRAALDLAVEEDIPYGGWCPRGGFAEDMGVPPGLLAYYPALQETPSEDPAERTEWNIRDCDAALLIVEAKGLAASQGSQLAERFAEQYGKPHMVLKLGDEAAMERAGEWLSELTTAHRVDQHFQLSVGGPRESEAPGIYDRAKAALKALIGDLA